MKEQISVIIPIYNVEKYLSDCVESVLKQTYTDLEIILVDDGSQDASGQICDDYAKQDSRVQVIHKKNGGLSSARNAGIDQATGQYFFFLDSDDWIAENALELLYKEIKSTGSDLALCNMQYVDEQGKNLENQSAYRAYCMNNELWTQEDFWKHYKGVGHIVCVVACNKLYKRELFIGKRYAEGKIREDEAMIHHMISGCQKIVCVNAKLYFYRQRDGSIMNNVNNAYDIRQMDAMDAYIDRVKFFLSIGKRKWAKDAIIQGIAFLEWYNYGNRHKTDEIQQRYDKSKKEICRYGKALIGRPVSFVNDMVILLYLLHIFPYRIIRTVSQIGNR